MLATMVDDRGKFYLRYGLPTTIYPSYFHWLLVYIPFYMMHGREARISYSLSKLSSLTTHNTSYFHPITFILQQGEQAIVQKNWDQISE